MDDRQPLAKGQALILGGSEYFIHELIGFGASSFVYTARYNDNLQSEKTHTVLIKELFPYHPNGLIMRGGDGRINVADAALDLFELHKNSFLWGNAAHLDLANNRADMASVNINSYEANGTYYTLLGYSDGETLQSAARRGEIANSLIQVVMTLIKTLDALEIFHQQRLLHLDISPDNILLMPPSGGRTGRRVILIDYNSVWSMDELKNDRAAYFSFKDNYSAPEVRMNESSEVSAASDLFSVCAIFLEYLRGEPMSFAALYSGEKMTREGMPLLDNVSASASSKAMAIVKKGLRLAPGRRYQSVTELRIDFVELLQELTGAKRKRFAVVTAGAILVALTVLIVVFGNITASYPNGEREIHAVTNTITVLGDCLGRLGAQMDDDMDFLENGEFSQTPDAPPIGVNWSADELITALGARSPIPRDILTELLESPDTYTQWSAEMRNRVARVTGADSSYPEKDRAEILDLYAEYIESYGNAAFIKTQMILLPLNADGKEPLLDMLPYMRMFGEQFLESAFTTDKKAMETALEAENMRLWDIEGRLNGYGV